MRHLFLNPKLQKQLQDLLKAAKIPFQQHENGEISVRGHYEEASASLVDAVRSMVFPAPIVTFLDDEAVDEYLGYMNRKGIRFEQEVRGGRRAFFCEEDPTSWET